MDSPVDEIKRRIDVADVIGQAVTLKRAGRILKGLCPFHSEKSPSFVVFPETGTWRCFGCSQGGDLFTFVMKHDGLEFGDALRSLAQKAGVELNGAGPTGVDREHRDLLLQALDSAVLFYQGTLRDRSGQPARAYLERRGVADPSIVQFALGYAPRQSGALIGHLRSAGVSMELAEAAGLVGRSDEGELFERLRGRLIFPIRDGDGKTIAFGGRTLDDEIQPKYLNSPQTELFDKSSCFYGYDLARTSMRTGRSMTVVEGYMDVIMAHQGGFNDVVATLGTALTERHIRAIRRQVDTVVLALDADVAGQKAMRRGLDVVRDAERAAEAESGDWLRAVRSTSSSRLQLKVMVLPDGKDPDDVIRDDPEAWRLLASSAVPAVDFVLTRLGSLFDLSTARGKSEAVYDALPVIRDLADPIERTHYEQRLAEIVGVERFDLARVVGPVTRVASRTPGASLPRPGPDQEEYLLALCVASGDYTSIPSTLPVREEVKAFLDVVTTRISVGESAEEVLESLSESAFAALALVVYQEAERLRQRDSAELIQERKTAILNFERGRLYREVDDVQATLLHVATEDDPERNEMLWVQALDTMTHRIHEIESELSNARKVGTVVWRPRTPREVLGA
ncbi:MAG: DNA primase [Chloroflexota bacterium]